MFLELQAIFVPTEDIDTELWDQIVQSGHVKVILSVPDNVHTVELSATLSSSRRIDHQDGLTDLMFSAGTKL